MASMRLQDLFSSGLLLIALGSLCQVSGQTSDDPLTTDQVAVYRAFLATYSGSEKGPVKVADLAMPFDVSSPMFDACFKDFGESTHRALSTPALSEEVTKDLNVQLIHVGRKSQGIPKPSPDSGETMAIPPSLYEDRSLDDGSLILSDIIFSSDRRYAVFEVSRIEICMRCGSMSNYLIFENDDGKWRPAKASLCATSHKTID
jgi:hypothetical protein